MKYAVIQKYYDTGRIATIMKPCLDNETSWHKKTMICDVYHDVFDDLHQALEFLRDCKEESIG